MIYNGAKQVEMGNFILNKRFMVGLVLLSFIIAGCGNATGSDEPVYARVAEAGLLPGDAIPLPAGDAVLTVTGKIGAANSGEAIEMDMAAIEAAGLVEYAVNDPFFERGVVYRGPLMSELLDLWQVSPDATTLRLTALNDYNIEIPIALLREFPILFAVQADGEYMSIAERGPAMIVFPYDDYQFEQPATDAYWIWQIKSIEVN
jgi:hypothetical protein